MNALAKGAKQSARKIDVLVADDEPDMCEVLKDGLAAHGMAVRVVGNGRDAVIEALRRRPDAVLMDILMPVLSGIDALGMFKIIEPIRAVPVLMLTALKGKDDVVRSMRAGAADYIAKPFDLKDTSARIGRVVEQPKSEPWPIFKNLVYEATAAVADCIRIGIQCDLKAGSADDLAVLVRSLDQLQPLRIELDFEKVSAIDGRPVSPLVAIKEAAEKGGGTVAVVGFDAKRYRTASSGVIRNIFPVEEASPDEVVVAKKKVVSMTTQEDKNLSDVLSKISGLRFDFKTKDEYSLLDLQGELLAGNLEKLNQAFNAVSTSWLPVLVRLDGLTKVDSRGISSLVQRMADLKKNNGTRFSIVTHNREIQKAYNSARGNMVAGVYEDKDRAVAALRGGA